MQNKIHILLPVYNESKSIYDLLQNYSVFFKKNPRNHLIYIVNDNSNDDTEVYIQKAIYEFKNLSVEYIHNSINQGLAGILKENIRNITLKSDDNDILITMDGDNTHAPFTISEMLLKLSNGADVVIASRYCKSSQVIGLSSKRIFLSYGAMLLYKLRWNIKGVKDYTSNFRAYKISNIKELLGDMQNDFITETEFSAVGELLKNLAKYNPVIEEVPMTLNYFNKKTASNMKLLRTIFHTLKILGLRK